MRKIHSFFYDQAEEKFPHQVVRNFVVSLGMSLLLVAASYALATAVNAYWLTNGTSSVERLDLFSVLAVVAFAPLIETFLLIGGLAGLRHLGLRFFPAAMISGLAWGAIHGLVMPIRFAGTVFAFFVFGCAYMAWRSKSFGRGYWAAALPHMLTNCLVVLVALASPGV